MKTKISAFFLFGLMMLSASLAPAQELGVPSNHGREPQTPAVYVAIVYQKLAGLIPPFEKWAEASPRLKETPAFEKEAVKNEIIGELRSLYDLVNREDAIVVYFPTKLGRYSTQFGGYFIADFKEDTFFSYKHMDEYYGVVPRKILNHQFIKIDLETAKQIDAEIANENTSVLLQIKLVPQYADTGAPLELGKQSFRLLLAEVKDIKIFNSTGRKLLWENPDNFEINEQTRRLRELYR